MHRQEINRGRVAYEPNSLGGGCPYQAGMMGFRSFPEPMEENKVRGKPERFAEHYNQARLFYNSQTDVEKQHIIRAFRFELTKVQVSAVRERMVAGLRNVDEVFAQAVAEGLGMTALPDPLPKVLKRDPKAEVTTSGALSLFSRPGQTGIRTRRIAILVADGVDGAVARAMHASLVAQGAVPRYVGLTLGRADSESGDPIEIEVSMEAAPSVLWDAMIVPGGDSATEMLVESGHAIEFIKDQYRHCKPMLFFGASATTLLEEARVPLMLPNGGKDPGVIQSDGANTDAALKQFVDVLTRHRVFERETDPPVV
jgi:catalase